VDDLNPFVESLVAGTEHHKAWLAEYFEGLTEAIRAVSNVPITSTTATGRADEVLVTCADEGNADLVVMATHGRGPLERAWLGSVADRVARHIKKPLLLVRPDTKAGVHITDENSFKHILVALDGSEFAEVGLQWARVLGAAAGAKYTLVRVVPPPHLPPAIRYPDTAITQRLYGEVIEDSEHYLILVAAPLRDNALCVHTEVRDSVGAAHGVLDSAKQNNADLIVIATHGRGGIRRLAMGSVADKVVRGASVPVLLVRP
jgi:nucleotide-binding universal stress UspA family protein